MVNKKITNKLNELRRIETIDERKVHLEDVLLFPTGANLSFLDNGKIETQGLGEKLDNQRKDLLRIVEILDPLDNKFISTNVLSPRTYAESLNPILQHISVQCLLFCKLTAEDVGTIINLIETTKYSKTEYDKMWIAPEDYKSFLRPGAILYIMNRRVGGWDGSKERPVIELLGAGGHLGVDENFNTIKAETAIINELKEEVGVSLSAKDIQMFGGFHNKLSNELVMLCGAFLPGKMVLEIQKYALENYEEDTDGIYLGSLEDVISLYQKDASPFAGNEKAKPTNFPSQKLLMEKVYKYIKNG